MASTLIIGIGTTGLNIIEAAQALYEGHAVDEISRSDAGATNLTITSDEIGNIILKAKNNNEKKTGKLVKQHVKLDRQPWLDTMLEDGNWATIKLWKIKTKKRLFQKNLKDEASDSGFD